MKIFRTVTGEIVSNIYTYTMDIMKQYPHATIYIGTDSQNIRVNKTREEKRLLGGRKKRISRYCVVIAFRYDTRGVHYIYSVENYPHIKDKFKRLWKEAEITIEVAEWFKSKTRIKPQINFDFSNEKQNFSEKLVQSTSGWASSLGYKVSVKPDNQIATKAADKHCK